MLRSFHEKSVADSITKEDFTQARQLIQQTRSIESRAGQLIDLAAALVKKGDKKTGIEILGEVQTLLPVKAANQTELDLQIKLANAFSGVDVDRSLSLMSAVIDQINDITNATVRLAGFTPTLSPVRDGEFEVESNVGMAGVASVLSRAIRLLAEADFEKTKKILDRFERPEIRFSAYLHLARTILEPADDCSCSCPNPPGNAAKPAAKR